MVASLRNFALSRPRWLLVGSYNSSANVDIPAGGYFLINLREPPYSMAEGVVQVWRTAHKTDSPLNLLGPMTGLSS